MAGAVLVVVSMSLAGAALGGDADEPIPPKRTVFETAEVGRGDAGRALVPTGALLETDDGRTRIDLVVEGEDQTTRSVNVEVFAVEGDDALVVGWDLVEGSEVVVV